MYDITNFGGGIWSMETIMCRNWKNMKQYMTCIETDELGGNQQIM